MGSAGERGQAQHGQDEQSQSQSQSMIALLSKNVDACMIQASIDVRQWVPSDHADASDGATPGRKPGEGLL
jgi:hypothetical protein